MIGRGAQGKVLLVEKNDDKQLFAMKVVNKETNKDCNKMFQIQEESNIMRFLEHPFLCKLHYAFQNSKKLFLVMDFCQGGELYFHIRKEKKFAEEKARFYAAEIILAIEYLHKKDIIYRDLKPENILITDDGHIKLVDFGLSKRDV